MKIISIIQTMRGAITLLLLVSVIPANANIKRGINETDECSDRAQLLTGPQYNEGESSVRVLAGDPRRLVAAWTRTTVFSGETSMIGEIIVARRWLNGNWTEELVTGDADFGGVGDPWLDTAPDGTAYLSYVNGERNYKTYVRRIPKNGPLGSPRPTRERLDHPSLAVDQSSPERLYLVGESLAKNALTGRLSISEDGGKSWKDAIQFPARLSGYLMQGGAAISSATSGVAVAWYEIDPRSNPERVAIRVAPIDQNTGEFGPAVTVTETIGEWELPLGAATMPSISVVRHGQHAGEQIYLAWAQRTGPTHDSTDIMVSKSGDGGRNWSPASRVNDDVEPESVQVFPSIASLDSGAAVIAWYDTRLDPEDELTVAFASEIDLDGRPGRNVRLTDCPSYPDSDDTPIGDYFNPDSSSAGPVWVFSNIRDELGDSDVFLLDSLE